MSKLYAGPNLVNPVLCCYFLVHMICWRAFPFAKGISARVPSFRSYGSYRLAMLKWSRQFAEQISNSCYKRFTATRVHCKNGSRRTPGHIACLALTTCVFSSISFTKSTHHAACVYNTCVGTLYLFAANVANGTSRSQHNRFTEKPLHDTYCKPKEVQLNLYP